MIARRTVRAVKEQFPGRPLIVVTAHAAAARDELEVAEVVVKPFDVDVLVTAVRRALAI